MFKLNEYEKSVWLTQAQEELVVGFYNGSLGAGFEQTEEVRRYLVKLVSIHLINTVNAATPISNNNMCIRTNELNGKNAWFIVNEQAKVNTTDVCLADK
jgi:hypothetical protein